MTKYVYHTTGDFNRFVAAVQRSAETLSSSTTYEDGHHFKNNTVSLVYERYSAFGSNRVSLSITITQTSDGIELVAIPSGGSQAVFFKVNTVGEETFLDAFSNRIEKLEKNW